MTVATDADTTGRQVERLDDDGTLLRAVALVDEGIEIGRAGVDLACPDDRDMADRHARVRIEAGAPILQDSGEGSGVWLLDGDTLRPVGTVQPPSALAALRQPGSTTTGMEVREFVFDRNGEYLLRWETLPHNRDRRRTGKPPPPTMLEVVRLGER